MSLDVYLLLSEGQSLSAVKSIFIREDGQTKSITRNEWNARFPDCEPVTVECPLDDGIVYTSNITRNLNRMAEEAGIYSHLWRPDEIGITRAEQLIGPLRAGLQVLKNNPAVFEAFNPPNGWGSYETLVSFVEDYLKACERYPHAEVEVSR